MNQTQIILLPQQLPVEVAAFLEDYLFLIGEQNFLFSYTFEVEGYFVALEVLKNDKSKNTWKVRLPLQYVLASAHLREDESKRMGFLP